MTIERKKWIQFGSREERRRFFEIVAMLLVSFMLVALSRLEGRLFELSKALSHHQDFINSVVYFGLININVVLILILCFLLFRNIVKLLLDRRHGVIGSRLRTKLVLALVFFALAPTVLLFYISTRFLTESFDTWFSSRVEATMHRTREAGAMVYDRDQRRLASLARIALERVDVFPRNIGSLEWSEINPQRLRGFAREYKVSSVKLYDQDANLLWHNDHSKEQQSEKELNFVIQAIQSFSSDRTMLSRAVVDADEGVDIVRGVAAVLDPVSRRVLGVIVLEERFETQILQSVETIIREFSGLKPGAELIRISYVILLVLMTVIIVFSATWFGFYVARGIIAPIQRLAEATREVALGNYGVTLEVKTDDETGQLFRAFNSMTSDLEEHELKVKRFTAELERTNEELDRRRKYMEVILRNVVAGVLSVDPENRITSINPSAEKLLGLEIEKCLGQKIDKALPPGLVEVFWKPIKERVRYGSFSGEIDLREVGRDLTLLADATRILDENNEDLGVVIVVDDVSEQVKVQRVAAWREVARRIAHEIKNPLTPIKISAQRLLRKFGEEFEGKDRDVFVSCIETIVSEVDSLRDLVNEFSKFSRLPTVRTQPESINSVLSHVLSIFTMSYSQIAFDLSGMSEDLPAIPLDREAMVRVFTNIISNAIASIPEEREKGLISLRTRLLEDQSTIRVEISDNGCGIPDALKQRVLEPYFSTKREGTGLGLAIVNQIVSDHGGYLRIVDNPPQGTTVVIELPRYDARMPKRVTSDV